MRPDSGIAPLSLLLLEDHIADADLLIAELRRAGVKAEVKVVATKAAYVNNLHSGFDAIISDFDLPQFDAKEALSLLHASKLEIPFIVVSGKMGEDTAVDLIKLGAADYLLKDRLARLPQALTSAVAAASFRREKKANDLALRVSEERMRSTIESALDCIVTIDQQSVILDFNPAAEQTFGYEREAVVGRILSETIIPPHLREAHSRGMARFLESGKSRMIGRRVELQGMRADGSEFPLELTVSRLGTQEPPLFTAFMRDITERATSREELRRQEEQYRQLFEKNPSPMWVFDDQTLEILMANRAASELYGYSTDEFLKLNLRDLRPAEDIPRLIEAIHRDGVGFRLAGVWRHIRKDGSLLWVEVSSSRVEFEGKAARMSLINDITARMEAEQKVRESEAGLALAQRIAHFGSWEQELTSEGELDEATLRSSAEMYRIFGFAPLLLRSDTSLFRSAIHPDDRGRLGLASDNILKTGKPYDLEHRIVRGDGTERIVNVRAELVRANGNGGPDRILGTTQDITERKLAEKELKEADEKFRSIFENASEGIFQTSSEGKVLVLNPAAAHILGFSSAAEYLERSRDISREGYVDPHRRQQFKDLINENGSVTGFESEVYQKDGSIICISENARIVRSATGEVLYYEGTFENITERKRSERELRESESRLRAIIDNEPECVKTVSADGHLLEMNAAGLRMIEAESQLQVRGLLVSELIHPEDRSCFDELHRKAAAGGTGQLQFRVIGLKGTERWVETHSVGLREEGGGPGSVLSVARDITDQRRAEDAIRVQANMLDQIGQAVIATDSSGTIIYANRAAGALYGWTPPELLGRDIMEVTVPQTSRDQAGEIMARLQKGENWTGEFLVQGRLGRVFPVLVTNSPLLDDRGQLVGIIGISVDIADRKQAEALLAESERRLRFLNDFGDNIQSLTKPKEIISVIARLLGTHLGVSRCAYAEVEKDGDHFTIQDDYTDGCSTIVGGYRLSDFGARTQVDLAAGRMVVLRDVDAEFAAMDVSAAFHAIEVRAMIACPLIKNGALVAAMAVHQRTPRQWTNQEIALVHEVVERCWTIIERARAELKLEEQANLLNLTHDAIMVRDLDDRIEFWNHGAEALYGWTAEEACGRLIADFLHHEERVKVVDAQRILFQTGAWSGECRHLTKEGEHVIVRSRWTLVRDELGQPKSKLIINTDITEQKKVEEQFLRAQRLESIGTLASGVAHDLNNILAPILMGAAVLRRTEMPERDVAILTTIETCAQRGADIVKQVLTFARGDEGARMLLQPAHLINDMARIARETFPKSIAVQTAFSESLWPVEGDPTQLHQVLLNLSVNARDAMPAGGTLTISAENFPVDEYYASMTPGAKPGPHVLFEVTDTGTGIPRQIIDQIFDPFFTTKQLGHGTGLGLSTMLGIVKAHGGFVSVESELGRGTTFKIYLPSTESAAGVVKAIDAAPLPAANGELLLMVDDEKSILQMAQAVLEGHGYRVLTAGDAPEALGIFALRKDEIKLVLTDLAMPLMDGIALIRTLQKMEPAVRIIASTGRGSLDHRAHELAPLHVRACLTKPYNKDKLLRTLHDALNA
jgi:PAS domain S-box-containing protein